MGVLRMDGCKVEYTSAGASYRAYVGHRNYSKNDCAATAGKAWEHVVKQYGLIKELMEENRKLTGHVMDADDKFIELQGRLLGIQDRQLNAMAPTVERAVKESFEKSYASVTAPSDQPTQSVISPAVIQRAVKDIAEVEERSKNVIIFGLEEQDEEDVGERVSEIFDAVGEKPRPEAVLRLGNKRSDVNRPVIVKFRNTDTATGVLRKSQCLKNNGKFNKVFISPDRTTAQRIEQRKLVTQMKEQAADDTSRKFYIRNGQIESSERAEGAGGGENSGRGSRD